MLPRVPLLLLLFLLASSVEPRRALAQSAGGRFSELVRQLRIGDAVTLTGVAGQTMDGRVADLTDQSLTIADAAGDRRQFAPGDLQRVALRDSRRNGALIGLAAGVVPGAWLGTFVATYCENEARSCGSAPLVLGAVTGLVGLWIGADIDGAVRRTFHLSPGGSGRVAVTPVVGARRQALQLSVQF